MRQQGGSFLSITRTAWPHAALDGALDGWAGELALPVAVALAAAAHGIALEPALGGYLHAFTANLVSAGSAPSRWARPTASGPSRPWKPPSPTAERPLPPTLDDVGTAPPLIDWCSMRHETQYTRLFRS